jgi:hypothetical protein
VPFTLEISMDESGRRYQSPFEHIDVRINEGKVWFTCTLAFEYRGWAEISNPNRMAQTMHDMLRKKNEARFVVEKDSQDGLGIIRITHEGRTRQNVIDYVDHCLGIVDTAFFDAVAELANDPKTPRALVYLDHDAGVRVNYGRMTEAAKSLLRGDWNGDWAGLLFPAGVLFLVGAVFAREVAGLFR